MNDLDEKARGNKSIEKLKELADQPVKSRAKRIPVWLVNKNNKIGPYISQREAANDLGITFKRARYAFTYDTTVICNKENGNVYTKLGEKYKIKRVNRWDRELTKEDIMRFENKREGIKILCIDSKGNEIVYPSITQASIDLNISWDIINTGIKNGKSYNGYNFRKI